MSRGLPTPHDLYLFHEGTLFQSYRTFGSHVGEQDDTSGVRFTVWAPHAEAVYVAGDFNEWNGRHHAMWKSGASGVWSLFIPGMKEGARYKYEIHAPDGRVLLKSDPYAFFSEVRPQTASVVYRPNGFKWDDQTWRLGKTLQPIYGKPVSVYEMHLGSWKRTAAGEPLSYVEIADQLVTYVTEMGFTHIELLPLCEYPYDPSWGYQATGYYSVTSRYGTPEDMKYLVNRCHQAGIGVILDWVPGHFCKDDHGLRTFDGGCVYEYADAQKAEKPLWGTLSFDLGKPEVVSFLISNALFWMDVYHIDGLRVDAVANMLEWNMDKPHDQWIYDESGGTKNREAIAFLKKLNEAVFLYFPEALMIAEDSTAYPLVTAPVYAGGLGFNYKWNMGWMNDVLRYMQHDPADRRHHHNDLTFSLMYAFSENFVLPFSHDEVVHGKKSLLDKMPGGYEQKFANLRLLYGYMIAHPGKKLLFMGGEFGQFTEWNEARQMDWILLGYDMHAMLHRYTKRLFHFYQGERSLWALDCQPAGFVWLDADNAAQSIVSFVRRGENPGEFVLAVCNFSAVGYEDFRVGVPMRGIYEEVFNSDLAEYGGTGMSNAARIRSRNTPYHRQTRSISIKLPPLSVLFFKRASTRKAQQGKTGMQQEEGEL